MRLAPAAISFLFFAISVDLALASNQMKSSNSSAVNLANNAQNNLQSNEQSQEKMTENNSEQAKTEILPCGNKPNCVSTEGPESHKIKSWRLLGSFSDIKEAVKKDSSHVLIEEENFLHVVYLSRIFRFPDDVLLKNVNGKIMLRSSSRIGYSDMGVNRKRMQKLASELRDKKLIEIEEN